MIVQIYCYRDIQVGAFQKPFYDTNDPKVVAESICRTVGMMKKEDIVKAHVRDLELYHLGCFDDVSGEFQWKHDFLIRLGDYVRDNKEEDVHVDESVHSGSEEKTC